MQKAKYLALVALIAMTVLISPSSFAVVREISRAKAAEVECVPRAAIVDGVAKVAGSVLICSAQR